jgi:splicing factor 3A subunit 1
MVITGIIRPPPEIRAVADRTALYVAKNGRNFEMRILNSAKGQTPKFAFLHNNSPFHAYYEDRIQFYENGGEDKKDEKKGEEEKKDESTKDAAPEQKKKTTQKASAIDPIAKALLAQRSKIADFRAAQEEATKNQQDEGKAVAASIPLPPALNLVDIVAPTSATVVQLETMQLVAQFAALSGISNVNFLQQLTHREWNNPLFAFCQPRHGHFAYFSALVDAYRRIIGKWKDAKEGITDEVKELANNVDKCLEVAAYRAEYDRDLDEQRKQQEDGPMSALIDWHDFVVVETIDFAPEEVVELSMLPCGH